MASSPVQHVLMTADAVGGVWTYAVELAKALSRHGVRTTLATMGDAPKLDQARDAADVPWLRRAHAPYRLEWMPDPWDDLTKAGDWLTALAEEARPDVVHLNGYVLAQLPLCAPRIVVAHSCVLSWWRGVHREAAPPRWDKYRREVAGGLRAADAVVAPTRAMRDDLAREYGFENGAEVIPNGVDDVFVPAPTREHFVLASGRLWDEAKNVAALEAVAHRLPWPVYAAGDGQGTSQAGVRRLGRLSADELRRWMCRAAVYVSPARYEPFGLAVLEAALAGCALILGDIPSQRELWTGAALFVPPDDRDALVRAVERLARDAGLRHGMAVAARDRARSFSAARMARSYLHLYERVVAPRTREQVTVERCG